MTEKKYIALCRKVEQECQNKLRALGMTWRIINGSEPPRVPSLKKHRHPSSGVNVLNGSFAEALAGMPDEFTTRDVHQMVKKLKPEANVRRSAVSHALRRMAEGSDEFELVELGKGKRPSRFRRLKPAAK